MGARKIGVDRALVAGLQPSASISVVVAEHLPLLLRGIASLLGEQRDIVIAATVSNGVDALATIRAHAPNVAVLGLHMPGKGALEVVQAMAVERLATRVVIVANALKNDEILQAKRLGVRGIVLQDMPAWTLAQCIRMVHAGGEFVPSPVSTQRSIDTPTQSIKQNHLGWPLTARERAVVEQVKVGLSNKQIARTLGLTEGTVKSHLHRVYFKLHVHGRYALINVGEPEAKAAQFAQGL